MVTTDCCCYYFRQKTDILCKSDWVNTLAIHLPCTLPRGKAAHSPKIDCNIGYTRLSNVENWYISREPNGRRCFGGVLKANAADGSVQEKW